MRGLSRDDAWLPRGIARELDLIELGGQHNPDAMRELLQGGPAESAPPPHFVLLERYKC